MTQRTVTASSSNPGSGQKASPALAAFLRGVERRGAVLAELQCGDATAGDAALGEAMAQFCPMAGATGMDDWPRRFWGLLLSQPGLRTHTPVAIELDATDRLGRLGSGPRAALLLRLAAGLDEVAAAAVLGIQPASYRLALQSGLPHHADGRADLSAWQRLREQIHRRIKTLPPTRLERLARRREAALVGTSAPAAGAGKHAPMHPVAASRPRWVLPLLWGLLALCALAFAATFLPVSWRLSDAPAPDAVLRRELPEQPPASLYRSDAAAVTHRDFDLLADPAGMEAAEQLAFHAWLAARSDLLPADAARAPDEAVAVPADEAIGTLEGASDEL